VARLHPLDRVPELAATGFHGAGDDDYQSPRHGLPPIVKHGLRRRGNRRSKPLSATQVMDTVHSPDLTDPPIRQLRLFSEVSGEVGEHPRPGVSGSVGDVVL
jgi:hypothetical protein